jgi:hypothetical protein
VSSTDLFVYASCAIVILAGIGIMRLARDQRGMGAVGVALGVIGLVAYLTAEEGAPPPDTATPTPTIARATADATPAP